MRYLEGPPGLEALADVDELIEDRQALETKLSRDERAAFKELKPFGLSFVANEGPYSMTTYDPRGQVKRLIGHNRGLWPARLSENKDWRDTATATWDKSPIEDIGAKTRFRFWTRTKHHRDVMLTALNDKLDAIADEQGGLEKLKHGFKDLGLVKLDALKLEMMDVAKRKQILIWDDPQMLDFLRALVPLEREITATSRRGRKNSYDIAIARLLDQRAWGGQ